MSLEEFMQRMESLKAKHGQVAFEKACRLASEIIDKVMAEFPPPIGTKVSA